jgi:predicted PurR-regulated permease PerM
LTEQNKIPFYARAALLFIATSGFVYMLIIAQDILIPIVFATIVAILLNPFVIFLTNKKIEKRMAIFIAVILALVILSSIFYIIVSQISMFSDVYPQLKKKFIIISNDLITWASRKFNIKAVKITDWLNNIQTDAIDNIEIGEKISAIGSVWLKATLFPVYVFLILFYKTLFQEFFHRLFRIEHQATISDILNSTKNIVQSYLTGLFFEMMIVAALNSAGLLLLGIPYPIILGILGAVLNIVPYIGGIVAIALPMIIAFATKDSTAYPLMVLVIYITIQFIDNHYIIPHIVAKRVKINALVSIFAVLVGEALWGIPGMFLSIPLIAILKVTFDNIDQLKPWGFLLGNIEPVVRKPIFKRK